MDSLYIIIVSIIISLIFVFFGTTYYNDIILGFNNTQTVKIFFYWLIFISVALVFMFASTIIFYINIREKRGPRGPKGEPGYTGYIYVPDKN